MPAPENTSFDTARTIASFPASFTQDVRDGATTYTVYYRFVAPQTGLLHLFGFGGTVGSGYQPQTLVYQSTTDGGFPSTPVIDAFTRANENPLAAPWATMDYWWGTPLRLLSNAVANSDGSSPSYSGAYHTGISNGPDLEAYLTVAALPTVECGLDLFVYGVALPGPTTTFELLVFATGQITFKLYVDDVLDTLLFDITRAPLTPGDVIGLRRLGTTWTLWLNGALITSVVSTRFLEPLGLGIGVEESSGVTTGRLTTVGGGDSRPTLLISGDDNRPVQIQVTAGQEYFLCFDRAGNPTPALLTVTAQYLAAQAVLPGDLLVNDDTGGFPLIVASPSTDYLVKRSVPTVVAGEAGDALDSGIMAFEDRTLPQIVTYDANFTVIHAQDTTGLGLAYIRTMNGTKFYVGFDGTGDVRVRDLLATGFFGAVDFTLPGVTSLRGIAANNDETILYFSTDIGNAPVRRWDLVNGVELSVLNAGLAANYRAKDILVMPDGTIVVLYTFTGSSPITLRRYDSSGTILMQFTVTLSPGGTGTRLAYSGDRQTFWIMMPSTDDSVFQHYDLAGTLLSEVRHAPYNEGLYLGAQTTDPPLFGVSLSCPLVVMHGTAVPPEPVPDGCVGGGLAMDAAGGGSGCTS
jgi:hypothetical protein